MDIKITGDRLIINNTVAECRTNIANLLDAMPRKIDLDPQTRLLILDGEGVRYWTRDGVTTELQICLNERGRSEVFPKADFRDAVLINDVRLDWQTKIDAKIVETLKLTVDDDNLRFNVKTYFAKGETINYSLTLNDENFIRHISVSFNNRS